MLNPASQSITIAGVQVSQKLPMFGGGAQDESQDMVGVQAERMAEPDEDPDVVLRDYPLERKEIEEFIRTYEALMTPADLKDTMAGYFPAF